MSIRRAKKGERGIYDYLFVRLSENGQLYDRKIFARDLYEDSIIDRSDIKFMIAREGELFFVTPYHFFNGHGREDDHIIVARYYSNSSRQPEDYLAGTLFSPIRAKQYLEYYSDRREEYILNEDGSPRLIENSRDAMIDSRFLLIDEDLDFLMTQNGITRRTQNDYVHIINGTATGSKALFFSSQNNEEYITQLDEEQLELNGPFNKVMLSQNEEEFITQDEQELQTAALGGET